MRLIREVLETTNLIVESKLGKGKEYFIEGIFLQSELKNRNGRMYPESIMDNEVGRYIKESVDKNRAYGELGHPDTPSINLDRVSHMIVSLRKEGTNYIGKAKILETPMGMIARGLLDGGANLGVSSRALGSLQANNEGVQIVQDDFMLSTAADIVADPSAPDAFVRGIMESKEWVFVDGKFVEQHIEEAQRSIRKASSRNLQEAKIYAFQKFLSKIR
ncbi:prohead core scaffolding protein and protease [uncultured Caudovirales phage]|uniref:Prohead core scaffolding protein and protease n=1 Tax=uncultured Caudovirales phage TaxID=2100421 RepID=A0A6J5RYV4_9CAUD|nr:prohead core scaffolding protein and protease [uncultured Caudovirales phage]CAB4182007.1 prohead core scaffolding protein and protease [uncultured Caudovirales phage]CAB4197364.1 prohead core scaffolding protein and protease [uncultured Caudovirales phage]CAB4211583.1 prohead core scaffolding protein and protease [uncultured Caudovirales phage]CAB5238696.1 prohead core scaffolding protein and protease [uncultured Caudovirales phage]